MLAITRTSARGFWAVMATIPDSPPNAGCSDRKERPFEHHDGRHSRASRIQLGDLVGAIGRLYHLGIDLPGDSLTVETMPPFLSAAARFTISGGFLYSWRRLCGDPAPTLLECRNAVVVGLFLLVGGNGGVVWAVQYIPSSLAALLVATVPLWMILIDALRPSGERPSPKH